MSLAEVEPPLHIAVNQPEQVLLNEIKSGVYAETGALPKEEALCERFNVSRITVRRTLADLASQGYVERRHGVGTFVSIGVNTVTPTHQRVSGRTAQIFSISSCARNLTR